MRLVAFSDLHLDAPFTGGGAKLAELRRAELRRTLERIVELVGEVEAAALMCAGDLYEHDRFTPDTAAMLRRLFEKIHPVPVLISPGNHDWYGPSSIYATERWSPNVHVFDSEYLTPWDGRDDLDGVRVWGFAHRKPSGTGDPLDGFATEGEALHIGLFHGSEASGWDWAKKEDSQKQRHAPFSAERIETAGLAHCVVGHYHKRVEGDHHTYAGAPAALSFGEPGDGGAVEICFDPDGVGPPRRIWHDVSRLDVHGDLELDVTGCGDVGEIRAKLRHLVQPLEGIARVTLCGELAPAVDLDLGVLGADRARLEFLTLRTGDIRTGYELDAISSEATVRGEFVRAVRAGADLDEEEQFRVIVTGLRALDGRTDLEVA